MANPLYVLFLIASKTYSLPSLPSACLLKIVFLKGAMMHFPLLKLKIIAMLDKWKQSCVAQIKWFSEDFLLETDNYVFFFF